MSLFGDQASRLMRDKWESTQELAEELYAMFTSQVPLVSDVPITITPQADGVSPFSIQMAPENPTQGITVIRGNDPASTFTFGGLSTTLGGITDNFGNTNFNVPTLELPPLPPGLPLPPLPPGIVRPFPPLPLIPGGDIVVPPPGEAPGGSLGNGYNCGVSPDLIQWPGLPAPVAPQIVSEAVPGARENPYPLYGSIVGKVSGNLYTVKCWAKPPGKFPAITTMTVRQGLIDGTSTIPNGTPCLVIAFPGFDTNGHYTIVDAVMQVPVWLE